MAVLILSNHSERSMIMQAIQNGASGYLLKNASLEELTDCIHEALAGNITFSKEIKEINYNGEEYEASEQNITLIKGEIKTEKSYRVEFEKDQDTGLIYRAVINEK